MMGSIHIARMARAATRHGYQVFGFPCHDADVSRELQDAIVFSPDGATYDFPERNVRVESVSPGGRSARYPLVRAATLAGLIRRLRPDIIHAQELQHGGHLTYAARRLLPFGSFPPVITSIWGSDLSLRARLPEELARIQRVLRHTDVLHAECDRDLRHARRIGYAGETILPIPVGGGFDLERLATFRASGPTSARRTIAVKGYQTWAGRATIALRAITLCGQRLSGYRVSVYAASREVEDLVETIAATDIEIALTSTADRPAPHDEIMALHGRSRTSIGISAADGISTSFLEAIVMGSFPIQSATACVSEWSHHGVSGMIIDREDPADVASAIRTVIDDDRLVDDGVRLNDAAVRLRLSQAVVDQQLMATYDRMRDGQIVRADALHARRRGART